MNDSRHTTLPRHRLAGALLLLALAALLFLLLNAERAAAQSQDLGFPTPVSTNEISGRIAARDIGDARLTRHYYLLTGTPGDLIFTVTSNNLNGDVDLFTAGSLRPMGKISIYAGTQPSSATKTVFLRQRESLILRVEARSANDNDGTYSVRFAGTFEPVMTAPAPPEESTPQPTVSERRDKGVRRVTSSGARIEEPEPEPEPTAARTETTTTAETTTTPQPVTSTTEPSGETARPAEAAPSPAPAVRTARTRRPRGGRRSARPATTAPAPQPQPSEPSTENPSTNASTAPTDATPAQPALNPRLIIETRDGMRQERFMSTVRSVTVQNGQVVIVPARGKVERISLSSILKMTIEP